MARKKETAAERQARAKANYNRLRAEGFSAADARRYRYSTEENIQKALEARTLPEIREEKRGAKKLKTKTHKYASSTMREIYLDELTEGAYKKAWKEIQKGTADGFKYANVVIEKTYATGQQQYYSQDLQPIKDLDSIDDIILQIEQASEDMGEYYESIGSEKPQVRVIIRLWKPNKKAKKPKK